MHQVMTHRPKSLDSVPINLEKIVFCVYKSETLEDVNDITAGRGGGYAAGPNHPPQFI